MEDEEAFNVDGVGYILDQILEGEISDAEGLLSEIEDQILETDEATASIYQIIELEGEFRILIVTAEQE